MSTKHTPSPWEHGPRIILPGQIDRIPVGQTEYTVASVHCYGENAEANARLIAAAPELLAVCKFLIEFSCIRKDETDPALVKCLSAVAKAEGSATPHDRSDK